MMCLFEAVLLVLDYHEVAMGLIVVGSVLNMALLQQSLVQLGARVIGDGDGGAAGGGGVAGATGGGVGDVTRGVVVGGVGLGGSDAVEGSEGSQARVRIEPGPCSTTSNPSCRSEFSIKNNSVDEVIRGNDDFVKSSMNLEVGVYKLIGDVAKVSKEVLSDEMMGDSSSSSKGPNTSKGAPDEGEHSCTNVDHNPGTGEQRVINN